MTQPESAREQAEQRLRDEALRIARSTQQPGQTKEQTRLIAKGIEKGIAVYKQQQNAKSRERDKARKKAIKQKLQAAEQPGQEEQWQEQEASKARPALWIAGGIFSLVAIIHIVRYFRGWRIVLENFELSLSWSLVLAPLAAGLAIFMFRSARD